MNKIIRSVMAALLSILFILALPMGVSAAGTKELIVAGTPFGVKIQTEGVIVVGIPNESGPASAAGLKRGDVIVAINGNAIESAEEFSEKIKASGGNALTIDCKSGTEQRSVTVTPVTDAVYLRLPPCRPLHFCLPAGALSPPYCGGRGCAVHHLFSRQFPL